MWHGMSRAEPLHRRIRGGFTRGSFDRLIEVVDKYPIKSQCDGGERYAEEEEEREEEGTSKRKEEVTLVELSRAVQPRRPFRAPGPHSLQKKKEREIGRDR